MQNNTGLLVAKIVKCYSTLNTCAATFAHIRVSPENRSITAKLALGLATSQVLQQCKKQTNINKCVTRHEGYFVAERRTATYDNSEKKEYYHIM